MHLLRYLIAITLLSLSLPLLANHLADDIEPGDGVNEIQLPLTKESAAELIRMESKGKILSVDQALYQDNVIYKIKVLHDDGKIKIYRLDPKTAHKPH